MMRAVSYASVRMLHVVLGALVVAGAYFALVTVGPMVDGRLFPVVRDFAIIASDRHGAVVRFRTTFTKARACDYIGLSWFVGDPAAEFERVQIDILDQRTDAPRTRPVGRQRSGWWEIAIPSDIVTDRMFGVLYHDCGMPWQTQTIIGPVLIPTTAPASP